MLVYLAYAVQVCERSALPLHGRPPSRRLSPRVPASMTLRTRRAGLKGATCFFLLTTSTTTASPDGCVRLTVKAQSLKFCELGWSAPCARASEATTSHSDIQPSVLRMQYTACSVAADFSRPRAADVQRRPKGCRASLTRQQRLVGVGQSSRVASTPHWRCSFLAASRSAQRIATRLRLTAHIID